MDRTLWQRCGPYSLGAHIKMMYVPLAPFVGASLGCPRVGKCRPDKTALATAAPRCAPCLLGKQQVSAIYKYSSM